MMSIVERRILTPPSSRVEYRHVQHRVLPRIHRSHITSGQAAGEQGVCEKGAEVAGRKPECGWKLGRLERLVSDVHDRACRSRAANGWKLAPGRCLRGPDSIGGRVV